MKYIFKFFLILFFNLNASNASNRVLRIFTTRSISRKVGKELQKDFLQKYNCKVIYVQSNGISHMLSLIQNKNFDLDLILGLFHENFGDENIRNEFIDLPQLSKNIFLEQKWNDIKFWPLFYGKLAFVYDDKKIKKIPKNFEELCNGKNKILIMDPRTSNVGISFLLWIQKIYGLNGSEAFWKKLKPRILNITKGWSDAYAMFMQGEAPIVLSYTTSPAYHRIKENNNHIKAAIFDEGHYLHYSVSGILKKSKNKDLAFKFLELVITKYYQKKLLYESEWNYPICKLDEELPKEFLIKTKTLKPYTPKEFHKNKDQLIKAWIMGIS